MAAEEAGADVLKVYPEESPFDLFARVQAGVRQRAEELQPDKERVSGEEKQLLEEWEAAAQEGGLSPWLLAWWLRKEMQRDDGPGLAVDGEGDLETLEEQVRFEIFALAAHDQHVAGTGAVELDAGGEDPDEKRLQAAQSVVYGWPKTEMEATRPRDLSSLRPRVPPKGESFSPLTADDLRDLFGEKG